MKRGESGLSFVVGIDKPIGMTSHDVVNRCRRIFNEKRIGHTGTLDPLASGAMAVCVGSATRLSPYLTAHDKVYIARLNFGKSTDTDDADGATVRSAPVPVELEDHVYAKHVLESFIGRHNQMPPAYSARKVAGVKSYEAARRGTIIALEPRPVEVHAADLLDIGRGEDGLLFWDVRFEVSAGTYIRSLARDLGISQGTCAHLGALRRLKSGRLSVGECVSLEALEDDVRIGRIDPIALLGLRYMVVDDAKRRKAVANGGKLSLRETVLHERIDIGMGDGYSFSCTPPVCAEVGMVHEGETVAVLVDNKLMALYVRESGAGFLKPCCIFAQGVSRGIV